MKTLLLFSMILAGCTTSTMSTTDKACLEANALTTNLSVPTKDRHYALQDGTYCEVYDHA